MQYLKYVLVPMIISAVLILPVKQFAFKFGLFAKENNRTVHHGNIPRIGGVAIFVSFIICSLMFLQDNRAFDGIVLGAVIIFAEGFVDDAISVKPIVKILAQFAATTVLIFVGGVYLNRINLPFISFDVNILGYVITYLWVIGITNAINLIDGLDGLAGGFCTIVLITIALLSPLFNKMYVAELCLILAGSIIGFLFYNFHPASIFMGDCGSQFLGYMIASVSLFGFKSTTFITLAIPITLLFIPIMDTMMAIVRRKLKGQKITDPDKGHLHHILMNRMRLGQVGAVLVIYVMTALFGLTAYMYVKYPLVGFVMLMFLILLSDLFIEYTGMITPKYRPILNLFDKFKHMFAGNDNKN